MTEARDMARRRTRRFLLGILVGSASVFAMTSPVAAECSQLDPWPSFTEAAPTSSQVLVGEVVESYFDDSADNAIHFRVRVDEVLRGSSEPALEFREAVRSGAPLTICPGDSILRVRVGHVLAFAFDSRVSSSPDPVLAVAWIRGRPDTFLMPGAERLTLARVRELVRLPATDTVPSHPGDKTDGPPVALFVALFGGVALLVLRQRPRSLR
jgi:hypothetical protein